MTVTDPLAFLQAAHARAEQVAQAATRGPWEAHPPTDDGDGWEIRAAIAPGREWRWIVGAESGGGVYEAADAAHIALHDPAAVLRRIRAERKILAGRRPDSDDRPECITCGPRYPCDTIQALAEAWGWQEGQRA